jgi:hypothetical protein
MGSMDASILCHLKKQLRRSDKMKRERFDIHTWFNLTYASYLVIPRSVLQSLPEKLQFKLTDVLSEIGGHIEIDVPEKGKRYSVSLRDEKGRFVHDVFRDYERGRKIINLKKER